ncbi:hypothetical protein [Shimia abyssi]|uniref:Uncharacterized protein n=1 Tax=Shimia abyssi TaxID=1662395 RepID=A0A2P8FG25_9RHOB|nr:hypothetical protein CLV88_103308 [Shimia abyssi]
MALWQGRFRWSGLLVLLLAFGLWSETERPNVLIAENGGLVGVLTKDGRAMSKAKGQGFVARNWLENDGSPLDQSAAASLWQDDMPSVQENALGDGGRIIHVHGKKGLAAFQSCDPSDVVVFSTAYLKDAACDVFDPPRLKTLGAVAIRLEEGIPQVITARQVSGQRLWNTGRER